MKTFSTIFILSLVIACASPAKLFQRGVKNIDKAVLMDPSLKLDSDTTIVTSTVTTIDTVDNVITITNIVTETETINNCNYDSLRVRSNRQIRLANKASKDYYKHLEKMMKLENKKLSDSLRYQKQANRQLTKQIKDNNQNTEKLANEKTKQEKGSWFTRWMGENWWVILITGLVGGFIVAIKVYKFKAV
jgi:hypothetical protein